jgi:hypothetical protein
MKKITLSLLGLFLLASQAIYAQCGQANETTYYTSQDQLDAISDCEIFQGDITITGADIVSIEALSSLLIVQGDLNIYETSIESIDALSNLMNAYEINIYNNSQLMTCCSALEWESAIDLGTIQAVNIISNNEGCNSYAEAQATCLGLIPGCTDPEAVNYNSDATFEDGTCLNGPDLQVSAGTILNSLQINTFTSSDECLVAEGCITGTGVRSTLRFTTTISNYGNEDFYIGESGGPGNLNPNFYWDDCHGHAHYEGYANYQLYSYPDLQLLPLFGHKNGWCVMDLGGAVASEAPEGANYPSCTFTYGCSIMGISAGCSDTYSSGISCQWLDITDLDDGEYVLAVSTNKETPNYVPQYEIDYSNNTKYILFEFAGDEIYSASEFDGSSISDVCNPDVEITAAGFNYSDEAQITETGVEMPQAFLNEYYTESSQVMVSETINLNGTIVSIDSLEIVEVTGLPVGLNWACEPQSCSFPVGNSCAAITGIPELTGTSEISINSILHLVDENGESQLINLPYTGGNTWLDNLVNTDYSALDVYSPSLTISVEMPVYGCMDTIAMNFNPDATFDDGSCESYAYGCTDPFALNYDEEANTEDGSCEYCLEGAEWVVQFDLHDSYGDGWNGNYYYITNEWGDTTATGTLESGSAGTDLFCLAPGCYVVSVPSEGGWPYEVSWEISSAGFPDVYLSGECPDLQPFNFLSECEIIFGCTDTLALNYLETAQYDDGSCEYPVYGCTDEAALNYNENATHDDESCLYPIECDETTSSYVLYLHDSYGDGWNGNDFTANDIALGGYYETTMESGSESVSSFCLSDGCYLITVDGGTWQGEITWDLVDFEGDTILSGDAPYQNYIGVNSTCVTVAGCTDPEALNYNDIAGVDDGSCEYPFTCDEGFNPVVMHLQTDPYPYETSWDLISETGDTLIALGDFTEQNTVYMDSVCVPANEQITFNLYDTYGDGLTSGAGNGLFHLYVCGVQVFSGSAFEHLFAGTFTDCDGASIIVFGCTDEAATNYSPDANTDDGTCEYDVVFGCMDPDAINYSELATDDDGSCEYITCEFYEMLVEINLLSTNGNGWDNLNYQLSSFDESVNLSGTLEDGFEQTDYYCLPNGCYLFTVPEYNGNESFNWSIIIEEKKLISGSSGSKDHFGVNEECELILGCTDNTALNYSPLANVEDGSCIYENTGSQTIYLTSGWNLISSYIQSENMDVASVVSDIENDVVIVKNGIGMAYLPDWGFNGIGDWNNLEGYQIKVVSANQINIEGTVLSPESNAIPLNEGWNMISYLRSESAPTDAVFEDVVENVVIVKNGIGQAYLPDWGFNGIGDMEPGNGYQVKMLQDEELVYNSNDVEYRSEMLNYIDNSTSMIEFDKNTGNNMHIVIPQEAWELQVSEADELYMYDASGKMVGAAKISLPNTVLTIWGDDLQTSVKDGLSEGESWTLKLGSSKYNEEIVLTVKDINAFVYEENAVFVLSNISANQIQSSLALYNSVPNPATQHTEIAFYAPVGQELTLKLYNVLGEEIQTLRNGFVPSGYHSINLNVAQLAAGSYFYRLQSDTDKITKRLEVIK